MNQFGIFPRLAGMLALLGCMIPVASLASGYAPDFRWNRSQDWVPGTVPGSITGNPSADKNGNPVWFYGYTSGGDLGSANPWYEQELSPLVWDDEWWGGAGDGVWARGYKGPGADNIGTNPPIGKWAMIHDMTAHTKSSQYMPVVEWHNPVGNGAIVNVGGSFKVSWEGQYASNSPVGLVDIAIARLDASTGSIDLLYSATLVNPTEGDALSSFSTLTQPWNVSGLRLDEGDALRFTVRIRGDEHTTPFWVSLDDQSLSNIKLVSIVPEPEQFILLALGLGVLAVRLRRYGLTDRTRHDKLPITSI
ncbi:MAG: hypothetical protein ABI865_08055 [Nitrosospira sp.]